MDSTYKIFVDSAYKYLQLKFCRHIDLVAASATSEYKYLLCIPQGKWIPQTYMYLAYNMRVPLTNCGFHLQLRIHSLASQFGLVKVFETRGLIMEFFEGADFFRSTKFLKKQATSKTKGKVDPLGRHGVKSLRGLGSPQADPLPLNPPLFVINYMQ